MKKITIEQVKQMCPGMDEFFINGAYYGYNLAVDEHNQKKAKKAVKNGEISDFGKEIFKEIDNTILSSIFAQMQKEIDQQNNRITILTEQLKESNIRIAALEGTVISKCIKDGDEIAATDDHAPHTNKWIIHKIHG